MNLKPTGDSALDAALNGSSTLISLEKSAPVGGFALTERARRIPPGSKPPCEVSAITRRPSPRRSPAMSWPTPHYPRRSIRPQPTRRWRSALHSISGRVSNSVQSSILPPSPQVVAAHLTSSRVNRPWPPNPRRAGRLLDALRADSYPLAKVDMPMPSCIRPKPAGCDFPTRSWPKAEIGPISFNGLKNMNEAFVRKRLLIHQGEAFSPQAVEKRAPTCPRSACFRWSGRSPPRTGP